MLNLNKGAGSEEIFHLQIGKPVAKVSNLWFFKLVTWSNLILADGSAGVFKSWWILGNFIHWYKGNCKCDGTRTRMYWMKQLDDGVGIPYIPDMDKYVMTITKKEQFSVRFFVNPGDPVWDNMGGS